MINLEFMRAYKLCVETCMGIKGGEKILIISDLGNMDRAEALVIASYMAEAEPFVLSQSSLKKFAAEPPQLISECMRHVDVVLLSLPFFYQGRLFHTRARKEATAGGVRFGGIWLTRDNMGITREEILQTKELTEKIGALLTEAEKARVWTRNGTDLTMNVGGRTSVMLTSIVNKPGDSGAIPDFAEAAIAPIEGSAEGVVVVDGSIATLGGVVEPVVLKVKEGRVIEIKGKNEAQNLKDLMQKTDSNSSNIAELGVGTVSRGKVAGADDDKRILGTGHIGIGDNRFGGGNIVSDLHIDSVFMNMTLELDGKIVMEDGVLKI